MDGSRDDVVVFNKAVDWFPQEVMLLVSTGCI